MTFKRRHKDFGISHIVHGSIEKLKSKNSRLRNVSFKNAVHLHPGWIQALFLVQDRVRFRGFDVPFCWTFYHFAVEDNFGWFSSFCYRFYFPSNRHTAAVYQARHWQSNCYKHGYHYRTHHTDLSSALKLLWEWRSLNRYGCTSVCFSFDCGYARRKKTCTYTWSWVVS